MSRFDLRYLRRLIHYSRNCLALRRDDVWLTSFPRSGNSWIRILLMNYSFIVRDLEPPAPNRVDHHMHVFGYSDLWNMKDSKGLPWRLLKTHLPHNPAMQIPKRRVLLVRDPFDVLSSYYRYRQALTHDSFTGDIDAFVRTNRFGIHEFCRHLESWRQRRGCTLWYEDCQKDPEGEVYRLFRELGNLPVEAAALRQAIKRAQIGNIRRSEALVGVRDNQRFRSDFQVTGGSQRENRFKLYSEDTVDLINSRISSYPELERYVRR